MKKSLIFIASIVIAGVNLAVMNTDGFSANASPSWCDNSAYKYWQEKEAQYQNGGWSCGYNSVDFSCRCCGQKYRGCQPIVGTVTVECIPTKCMCSCN